MNEKVIVLVGDKGDSKHGEISIVDDPRKAEKLVEALLEAGFERERIHVFAGRESDFQVSQRPVVALVGEGEEGEPQVGVGEPQVGVGEPQPGVGEPQVRVGEPQLGVGARESAPAEPAPAAEVTETGDRQEEQSETEEEAPETAETAAPVKFSSLFRSA